MTISLNEHLILGILTEGPQHGYRIEQIIAERGMRQWSEVGFSSLYYILDKLEKKGLATSKASIGKEKKEYQITTRGKEVLKQATYELICQRKPANTHLMTALATSFSLDDDELVAALLQRKENLEADLAVMHHTATRSQHNTPIAQRLFHLGQVLLVAELEWINQEIIAYQGGKTRDI